MNPSLAHILHWLKQSSVGDTDKASLETALLEADKAFERLTVKLHLTEEEKHTTALLLGEMIAELEQKRIVLESQNRKLEIETALEQVRTIALSMQQPSDMLEVCRMIASQLQHLGIHQIRNVQTAIFYESKGTYLNFEYYAKHDRTFITEVHYDDHPMSLEFAQKMLRDPDGFYTHGLNRDELLSWYNFQKTTNQFADPFLEQASSLNYYWHSTGPVALGVSTYEPLQAEEIELFIRFRNVFGLAYRRYRDLEIAQEQTREARIELALERVRARTMAMQKSEEMVEASHVLFNELNALGIEAIRTGIATVDEEKDTVTVWSSQLVENNDRKILGVVPRKAHAFFEGYFEAWEKKAPYFVFSLSGEELVSYYTKMTSFLSYPLQGVFNTTESFQVFFFPEGSLNVITHHPLEEQECQLLVRFARVFGLIYRRFLDLKRAEAQMREAQIEAALEKVRSRSMAMQNSEELKDVIQVVFEQLVQLHIQAEHSGFVIDYKTRDDYNIWVADPLGVPAQITIPYFDSIYYNSFNEAKAQGLDFFSTLLPFEEKNKFYEKLFTYIPALPEKAREFYFSCPALAISTVLLDSIGLYIENFAGIPYTEEENGILMRFGKVFQQTYTRFLDLQKAEAQARESQIEAALERVRARTMAMQKSDELTEASAEFFSQLKLLGEPIHQLTIGIVNENEGIMEIHATVQGNQLRQTFRHPLREPYVMQKIHAAWKAGERTVVIELPRHELVAYNEYRNDLVGEKLFPVDLPAESRRFITGALFSQGVLALGSDEPRPPESLQLLERFAAVFHLTYTRFLDLQRAEEQAREAQIEAALEKVRSRTMGMQKSDELAETAAIAFRQLILLGIAPTRLYIGIIHDDSGNLELWATDEDGSRVDARFSGNIYRSAAMLKMYNGWKQQLKSLIIDMQGQELADYLKYLTEELKAPFTSGLYQKRRVQTIAYFSKGFIGIASSEPQPEETTLLLERFAYVLNLTFTRFHDLILAEQHAEKAQQDLENLIAEKKRTEEALTELRSTQAQLIQAEKMASLGELTAGIAHEIQNPLNFVNNFSEVNTELITELETELQHGHLQEAELLAKDIKDNEQKIVHHGKRADAIVKSMLMHSRTGTGQKEPTDINALVDEYVRLAYHGMRAKDKSFNVDFKTDLDPDLPKINVVPQDIGRVLLNLINNAFQALSAEALAKAGALSAYAAPLPPKGGIGSTPRVVIKTKSVIPPSGGKGVEKEGAEITISDNGPGIPDSIKEKIFQPFFTTKPTGQGTGLGLSLSYDIIKAHGGEIKLESKENEGTSFMIYLPQ